MIACPQCTFENSDLLPECEICQASLKPQKSRPVSQSLSQSVQRESTMVLHQSPVVEQTKAPKKVNKARQPQSHPPSVNQLPAVAASTAAPVFTPRSISRTPAPILAKVALTVVDGVRCNCFCTRHTLVGSCIECGRPVCKEEEWMLDQGCPFCKTISCIPCKSEEQLQTEQQYTPTMHPEYLTATLKAYRAKDRLLAFDKQHTRRTQVLDSQADYYESTAWLSEDEKNRIDKLQEKKRAENVPSSRRCQMTLDIAGRKVFTQNAMDMEDMEKDACEDLGKDSGSVRLDDDDLRADAEVDVATDIMPETVVEENRSLQYNKHKVGEVYRLLKETLAPWRGTTDTDQHKPISISSSNPAPSNDQVSIVTATGDGAGTESTLKASAPSFVFKGLMEGPKKQQQQQQVAKKKLQWKTLDQYLHTKPGVGAGVGAGGGDGTRSFLVNTTVRLVQKQDQPTGKLTEGVVERVLTNGDKHQHGLKVMLKGGIVGRVKSVAL